MSPLPADRRSSSARALATAHLVLLLAAMVALASGCAPRPRHAERIDYDPPRWEPMPNLLEKARVYQDQCEDMLDPAGMLCYWQSTPWERDEHGEIDPTGRRYQNSHNIADAPAWQGYLMAATALRGAVAYREADAEELAEVNELLQRLAGWYLHFFEVTGERGLIGRTMLAGYTGEEPADFMYDDRGGLRWTRSPHTGEWWVDELNKNHLNLAIVGLATPLALERRAELALSDETRGMLLEALIPMAARLEGDNFIIRTSLGTRSPFPDLSPNTFIIPNGFQRVISWQILASAAPYDEHLHEVYEGKLARWRSGVVWSLDLVASWSLARGRWNPQMNISTSDAMALALASFSFFLQEQDESRHETVKNAVAAWWRFMQYELNAPYSFVYAAYVEDDADRQAAIALDILHELRDFPPFKHPPLRQRGERVSPRYDDEVVFTPGWVQPIHNRPIDSNYWKANSSYQVTRAHEYNTRIRFAGMDYLLAYWMGRYLNLLPAE